MKNFLKIFIFLEIILLAYIFNTSIYNIYEKNNIATEKLEGYVLEETSPEILDKFYTIFTEKYSQNRKGKRTEVSKEPFGSSGKG